MRPDIAKNLAKKDMLKCPNCGSKNILLKDETQICVNCGYKEEGEPEE